MLKRTRMEKKKKKFVFVTLAAVFHWCTVIIIDGIKVQECYSVAMCTLYIM